MSITHLPESDTVLQESLLSLESHLAEQGYSLQKLLSYLADLNEQEIHSLQQARKLELLTIFGGDDLIGLQKIFARYFDELSHKGLKTILITGGIGRLTTTLIQALLDPQTDGTFPSLSVHRQDDKTQIHFQLTEKFLRQKKVKTIKMPPFDLKASKESLLSYVAEADIYLELLLYEFLQHGYSTDEIEIVGYADYLRDSESVQGDVYYETISWKYSSSTNQHYSCDDTIAHSRCHRCQQPGCGAA